MAVTWTWSVANAAAIVLAAVAACSSSKSSPPADNQSARSGTRMTYRVQGADGEGIAAAVGKRLAVLGLADARARASAGTITVELIEPDPSTIERVEGVLARPGVLEVTEVLSGADRMARIYRRVSQEIQSDHDGASDTRVVSERLVTEPDGVGIDIDMWRGPNGRTSSDWYLTAESRERPAEQVLSEYLAGLARETDASGARPFALAPEERWGFAHAPPETEGGPGRARSYLLAQPPAIDNSHVASARVEAIATGQPVVHIELTAEGSTRLAELTERVTGGKVAFVIDGLVTSAPVVMERIGGGVLQLTVTSGPPGTMQRAADDLAAVLASGPLPQLRPVNQQQF